jgi:DNA-binding NarL/FixJ family response regulator
MLVRRGAARDLDRAQTLVDAAIAEADAMGLIRLAGVSRLLDDRLNHRHQSRVDAVPAFGLSKRELEVLQLIVSGQADKEIAQALTISPRTVTTHVTSILNKLGANSRTEAAMIAVRVGLLKPAPR